MLALFLLPLLVLSLSSCGSSPDKLNAAIELIKQTQYKRQEIPGVLVTPAPEPAKPALPLSDESAATYIIDLREWGRRARADIEAIGRITAPVDTK